jgi:hypothetical protein
MDSVWWRMDSVNLRKRTRFAVGHVRRVRNAPPPRPEPMHKRKLSVGDLEALGLGVTIRPFIDRSNAPVTRVYCLSCGVQVDDALREQGDDWARCPQGCNDPL